MGSGMYRANEEMFEGSRAADTGSDRHSLERGERVDPEVLPLREHGRRRFSLGRATESVLALLAIVAFAPLLLLLAAIIRVKLGGPVLFRQSRPGFEGKPFKLVKFRSMTDERGADGELLPDARRLTAL